MSLYRYSSSQLSAVFPRNSLDSEWLRFDIYILELCVFVMIAWDMDLLWALVNPIQPANFYCFCSRGRVAFRPGFKGGSKGGNTPPLKFLPPWAAARGVAKNF